MDILSPVIPFINYLKLKNIKVELFDPYYSAQEILKIAGVKSFKYPNELSKFDCIVISIDHKEFKKLKGKTVKNLKKCKFILDNMKVWSKLQIPKHINYKISGDKNWI